jgi:hypothetical protein
VISLSDQDVSPRYALTVVSDGIPTAAVAVCAQAVNGTTPTTAPDTLTTARCRPAAATVYSAR